MKVQIALLHWLCNVRISITAQIALWYSDFGLGLAIGRVTLQVVRIGFREALRESAKCTGVFVLSVNTPKCLSVDYISYKARFWLSSLFWMSSIVCCDTRFAGAPPSARGRCRPSWLWRTWHVIEGRTVAPEGKLLLQSSWLRESF